MKIVKLLTAICIILAAVHMTTRQAKAEEGVAGIAVTLDKVKDVENVFTKEETTVLYRIVEAEATGENTDAKKNIASVILNRVNNSDFPDSITDVVFQENQFSPISDKRYWSVEVTEETIKAVDDVLKAGSITEALYFCNLDNVSIKMKRWFKKLNYLFIDEANHSFYK